MLHAALHPNAVQYVWQYVKPPQNGKEIHWKIAQRPAVPAAPWRARSIWTSPSSLTLDGDLRRDGRAKNTRKSPAPNFRSFKQTTQTSQTKHRRLGLPEAASSWLLTRELAPLPMAKPYPVGPSVLFFPQKLKTEHSCSGSYGFLLSLKTQRSKKKTLSKCLTPRWPLRVFHFSDLPEFRPILFDLGQLLHIALGKSQALGMLSHCLYAWTRKRSEKVGLHAFRSATQRLLEFLAHREMTLKCHRGRFKDPFDSERKPCFVLWPKTMRIVAILIASIYLKNCPSGIQSCLGCSQEVAILFRQGLCCWKANLGSASAKGSWSFTIWLQQLKCGKIFAPFKPSWPIGPCRRTSLVSPFEWS